MNKDQIFFFLSTIGDVTKEELGKLDYPKETVLLTAACIVARALVKVAEAIEGKE